MLLKQKLGLFPPPLNMIDMVGIGPFICTNCYRIARRHVHMGMGWEPCYRLCNDLERTWRCISACQWKL
jgi:hypothetical protein